MENGGGYRDEREAMAAQLAGLQRDNAALREQAAQLDFVQRENAELRRRLGQPGAGPVRRRGVGVFTGIAIGVVALACLGATAGLFLARSPVTATAPVSPAYAPPSAVAAPPAVPTPAPQAPLAP